MADASWVEGDTSGSLNLTLLSPSQSLTSAAAVVKAQEVNSGDVLTLAATITDAGAGLCVVSGAVRGTMPAGQYALRAVVTYTDTSVDVFPSAVPEPTVTIRPAWA
jgi:hypothetical protein